MTARTPASGVPSPARLRALAARFASLRVAVVGDTMLDRWIRGEVRRISPEAPVPVVDVTGESATLGGAGNVAANIRSLGGKVFLATAVGRDENGARVKALLRDAGVEGVEEGVFEREDAPTVTKTRIIARTQQMIRIDRERRIPSAGIAAKITSLARSVLPECDAVLVSDYDKGVISPAVVASLRAFARRRGTILTVDPKMEHFSLYRGVTCLKPNRLEAARGVRMREPATLDEAAEVGVRILRRLACANVLMTLGGEGMVLFEKGGPVTRIPGVAREVYDVTGAGDTAIAALTLALAAGASVREAAVVSNFAAGVVVGKLGTATVTTEELLRYFECNGGATQLERLR